MRRLALLAPLAFTLVWASAVRAQQPDPAACVVERPGRVQGRAHIRLFENTCGTRLWLIVTTPLGTGAKARLGWRRRFPLFEKGKPRPVTGQYRDPELVGVCAYGDDACIARACNDGTGTECLVQSP